MSNSVPWVTDQDRWDFTEGACFLLAQAFEKETGWPPAAMWNGFRACGHVFTVMPGKRYIDVNGPQTRRQIFGRWEYSRHGDRRSGITTRHVHINEWELPWDDPEKYEIRARQLVPILLQEI